MAQNRTSRDQSDRETTQTRVGGWRKPGNIPSPMPKEGIRFKWVRKTVRGEDDTVNYHQALESGWTPCTAQDCPELIHLIKESGISMGGVANSTSGCIEYGGLVLMQLPEEWARQMDAYFAKQANIQNESVDAALLEHNDPRMPIFRNRTSKVSKFGHGGA